MFIGEYSHTIDAKGRLIVPSRFREQLGDEFVVTKGLDGCLFVYENSEWRSFEEKLHALPLTNANARKFTRFFLAGASACEVDRQGRILIPAVLREFAKLEKDVVLVGVGSRIEIWNKALWTEKNVYDDMEEIAENGFNLNIPRYVDTFEKEEEIDLNAVSAEIKQLQTEIKSINTELKPYFDELGLDFPFAEEN